MISNNLVDLNESKTKTKQNLNSRKVKNLFNLH